MPYSGKTIMPREIAHACYDLAPWRNYELTKALGTALGESSGSLGAWHDNMDSQGNLTSRDCGLYQINIPWARVGTPYEFTLRSESKDEAEWRPVLENNVAAALNLYDNPWTRDGKQDIRRWQPWVAYTTGWVLFPEFWVWAQDANGVPIGEWHPTGRFIHKAIAGQMNFHVVIRNDWSLTTALYYGQRYCRYFKVDPEALFIDSKAGILKWHVPPMPTDPPQDGIGPRPIPNDGS